MKDLPPGDSVTLMSSNSDHRLASGLAYGQRPLEWPTPNPSDRFEPVKIQGNRGALIHIGTLKIGYLLLADVT